VVVEFTTAYGIGAYHQ